MPVVDWLVLGGALLTGLLGGVHCVAMCGGIATGFGASQRNRSTVLVALQPNIGRVLGYALAGALTGAAGGGLLSLARTPALTLALRATVGLVLVVAALRLLDKRGRLARWTRGGQRWWQWLRPLQQRLLPADSLPRRLALGMLWGWMPCGLSTTMLAAAWLQASAWHGALTMLAFGMGTMAVMVPLTWSGARLGQRLQRDGWRMTMGSALMASGLLTMSAPWLMRVPALHGLLAAIGCRSAQFP